MTNTTNKQKTIFEEIKSFTKAITSLLAILTIGYLTIWQVAAVLWFAFAYIHALYLDSDNQTDGAGWFFILSLITLVLAVSGWSDNSLTMGAM